MPQLFIWGLSISKAPLQASTASSWARSGKPSRTRNRSSFQAPRRIFTLPARHCELNGPNRVSLSPLSGAGVTVKRRCQVKQPQREIDVGLTVEYPHNVCLDTTLTGAENVNLTKPRAAATPLLTHKKLVEAEAKRPTLDES